MHSDLYNFTRDLNTLSADDMFKISQELNTIEPSVGEIAKAAPLLERLTFLDWVSIAFVTTIIIFSLLPAVKKTKFYKALRSSS